MNARQPENLLPLLVVTDLDGTLLDHHSYSFEKALEAVERLRELHIPLIFNTSKTYAEIRPLASEMGINDPFIVENGSALFVPRKKFALPQAGQAFSQDFYVVELGLQHQVVIDRIAPLRELYQFRGMQEIEDSEMMQLTGLSEEQLAASRKRRYSEPLIWEDSDSALEEFSAAVVNAGLRILEGGRFHHVLGNTDKGLAMDHLRGIYNHALGTQFTVIGLGDSANDIEMLVASDWPVIIRSPSHGIPRLPKGREVMVSEHAGPKGWKTCVLALVEKFLLEFEEN